MRRVTYNIWFHFYLFGIMFIYLFIFLLSLYISPLQCTFFPHNYGRSDRERAKEKEKKKRKQQNKTKSKR